MIQSTIHFSKRTDKIMALLQKEGLFTHLGVEYRVESYFYRVEFQVFYTKRCNSSIYC